MTQHANMVKVTAASPGTGNITVSTAVSGFRTFATAFGSADAVVAGVRIQDASDATKWEIARGCSYTYSTNALSRGTFESSSTGSVVDFTGAVVVSVIATAAAANAAETVLTYADRAASYGFQATSDGSTVQTLTDAGYRLLHGGASGAFQTVEWNVGSVWSADADGRFTPPAGRWQVYAQITIQNVAANQRVFLGLHKNGTLHRMLGRTGGQGSTTQSTGTGGTCCVEANGTDYFDMRCYVDGAGTHLTEATAAQVYFGAEYRGPIL